METKKYLSLDGLQTYNSNVKCYVDEQISEHTHSWETIEGKPFGANYSVLVSEPPYGQAVENCIVETIANTYLGCAYGEFGLAEAGAELDKRPEGSKFLVIFDEDGYECTSFLLGDGDNATAIGNRYLYDNTAEDTGEPFIIYSSFIRGWYVWDLVLHTRYAGTYEVTIKAEKESILPEYLPDDLATKGYVDSLYPLKSSLETVAYTGSYNNLLDKPTIPSIDGLATKEGVQTKFDELNEAIPTGALADKDVVSESDLDSALAEKVNAAAEGNHSHSNKSVLDGITSSKVSAWDSSLDEAKTYTDTKTNGLASTSSVNSAISTHNTATDAHNDIRDLITGLTTRLNTLADSDDTTLDQMSELVAYIKSNKELIDGITTTKVNVSDIIDNLTTNVADKPLSAAQGVAIKGLIDDLQTAVDGKADAGHNHDSKYDAKGSASTVQTSLDSHASSTSLHFTTAEKTKLSGIESGAQKNTITGVKGNSESSYRTGNVNITKANIGLGNVDNTSDANKPVSTAQQTAIDTSLASAKSYADTKIANLINGAPTTLDTLGEIATAMAENEDVVEALESAIGNKVDKVSGKGLSTNDLTSTLKTNYDTAYSHVSNKSNPHGVTLSQLGVNATATELNYVDGVTSSIQTQLDGKSSVVIREW